MVCFHALNESINKDLKKKKTVINRKLMERQHCLILDYV
jgi:predicted RNase H-like nuclease